MQHKVEDVHFQKKVVQVRAHARAQTLSAFEWYVIHAKIVGFMQNNVCVRVKEAITNQINCLIGMHSCRIGVLV